MQIDNGENHKKCRIRPFFWDPGPYNAYIDAANASIGWTLFLICRFYIMVFRLRQGRDDKVVIWLGLLEFRDGEVWLLQNQDTSAGVVGISI